MTTPAAGETESTQRQRTAVVDARAELLRSAPAETSLPMRIRVIATVDKQH